MAQITEACAICHDVINVTDRFEALMNSETFDINSANFFLAALREVHRNIFVCDRCKERHVKQEEWLELGWEFILCDSSPLGTGREEMQRLAERMGYPFFIYNSRVYDTFTGDIWCRNLLVPAGLTNSVHVNELNSYLRKPKNIQKAMSKK